LYTWCTTITPQNKISLALIARHPLGGQSALFGTLLSIWQCCKRDVFFFKGTHSRTIHEDEGRPPPRLHVWLDDFINHNLPTKQTAKEASYLRATKPVRL